MEAHERFDTAVQTAKVHDLGGGLWFYLRVDPWGEVGEMWRWTVWAREPRNPAMGDYHYLAGHAAGVKITRDQAEAEGLDMFHRMVEARTLYVSGLITCYLERGPE